MLKGPFLYLHGDLLFNYKMLDEFIKNARGNAVLVDTKFPSDWDDAMKIISHSDEMKYMSKAITVNEMDGIAIGIYLFDERGGEELFKISEKLFKKNVMRSWISEAMNILAKKTTIMVIKNRSYPWVDVDNLTDLEMGKKIQKKIEKL